MASKRCGMIIDSDRELASDFVLALSDLDDIDVLVDAIASAREQKRVRGRPALPLDEQKAKINITIDKDLLEWIDTLGTKRSRIINKLLRQARQSKD